MGNKLLYIGKSNKKFTYNKLYNIMYSANTPSIFHYIVIYGNKNQIITIREQDYFIDNFKHLDERQIKNFERKMKLKKLKKG